MIKKLTWKLHILALKRNVFFSISDPLDRIKKLMTPGHLLRGGVKRDEYNKLSEKKDRRKKRSWRAFLNSQKRTLPACVRTWNLMYCYILEKKLRRHPFILILGGTNLALSKKIGSGIIRRGSRLNISQIIIKSVTPHNGCPANIKKRKKNKGRNRFRKRGLTKTNKILPASSYSNTSLKNSLLWERNVKQEDDEYDNDNDDNNEEDLEELLPEELPIPIKPFAELINSSRYYPKALKKKRFLRRRQRKIR